MNADGKRKRWDRRARGFTLVELMIAMALVGVLTVMIYGMFARTSDSLSDVESLSRTLERARFAMGQVRGDLQAAGSQLTPNSRGGIDPWVQPINNSILLQPLRVHDSWTGDGARSVYTGGLTAMGDANPESGFNSFIVVGAFDYPLSVMANNLAFSGTEVTMSILPNERGVGRLNRIDPFNVDINEDLSPMGEFALNHSDTASRMGSRMVRVMDQHGFFQFSPVQSYTGSTASLTLGDVSVRIDSDSPGLEQYVESDVEHDIAFVDAYYYTVRPSPVEPANLQLLRSRVDLTQLAETTGTLTESNLNTMLNDTVVVADYVVDFRIWFECADAGTGRIEEPFWPAQWAVDHSAQADNCLSPDGTTSEVHRARAAHVRLSLRNERENPNRPHFTLPGLSPGFDETGQMVTYDVVPEAPGSASVVTLQASVDLTNLAMRGL